MPDKGEQPSFFNLSPDGGITVRPDGKTPNFPEPKKKKTKVKPEEKNVNPATVWDWTNQEK